MENVKPDPEKIRARMRELGVTDKEIIDNVVKKTSLHRAKNGEPMRLATFQPIASRLGVPWEHLVVQPEPPDPRTVVVFDDWCTPNRIRLTDIVDSIDRGQSVEVRWAPVLRQVVVLGRALAAELTNLEPPRAAITALSDDDRRWYWGGISEGCDFAEKILSGAAPTLAEMVNGMNGHFGRGRAAEAACATFLRLGAVEIVRQVLANARELVTADEIDALRLPSWTHARLDKYGEFKNAFGVEEPVAVHLVGLGDHADGAVNVFCAASDAAQVREICFPSLRPAVVGRSWVYELAIPQVALHRLLHGLSGDIEYDETVTINKIKHPGGRES